MEKNHTLKLQKDSLTNSKRFPKWAAFTFLLNFIITTLFSQVVIVNPTSPFIVPTGVTSIKVECWGGGGGGGGSQNSFFTTRTGGGGGGGGYSTGNLTVSAGQSYTITIGSGGTASSNANGGPGGTTQVTGTGGTVSAAGGAGGVRSTASTGGAGGIGNTRTGGAGGTGTGSAAGGGGGGAGNAANGAIGSTSAGGAGGAGIPNNSPYIGGTGGAPMVLFGSPFSGAIPGGGGGGGLSNTGTSSGGVGGAGQVIITYTLPPPVITSLGNLSGCINGGSITINGSNFTGVTASGITIGGTPVSSITSNSGTQIVAVVGNGTSGLVSVTSNSGTATSTQTFTVINYPAPSATNGSLCDLGVVAVSATPGTGGTTCNWYDATTGGNLLLANATNVNVTISASGSYTYYVNTANPSTGCISQTRSVVTASSYPKITATPVASSTAVCQGQTVNLTPGAVRVGRSTVNVPIIDATLFGLITTPVSSVLTVSGLSTSLNNSSVKIDYVKINISHAYVGDLLVKLTAPDASSFNLSNRNGGSGLGYTNTIFKTGGALITAGTAPFTGVFEPQQAFSNFNGKNPNGTWALNVTDMAQGDVGNILNWEIGFSDGNGLTYAWSSTPAGFNSTSAATSAAVPQNIAFNVDVFNTAQGCSGNGSIGVTANPSPSAVISSNAPLCSGNDINFSADNIAAGQSSGNTYSWTNPANTVFSTQQNPSLAAASVANNGNYTVTITNQFLCTAAASAAVTVNPNPDLSIASQQNVACFGQNNGSLVINASGGTPSYTFTSDFIDFNQDGIFSNLVAANYDIYVFDDNGCTDVLSTTVSQPDLLAFTPNSTDEICPADGNGSISFNTTGGTTPYQFSIDNGASFLTSSLFSALPPASYVTLVQDANGCLAPAENVDIILVNTPSTAASDITSSNGFNICIGNSSTLAFNGGSLGSNAVWNWHSGTCNGPIVGSGNAILVSPAANTSYFLTAEDACGATPCALFDMVVSTAPVTANVIVPFTGMPSNICSGSSVSLSIAPVLKATQYIWDAPAGSYFNGNPVNVSPFITTSPQVDITYGNPIGSLYSTGVQASNACGSSLRKIQKSRGITSVPAGIIGATTTCENSSITYNTPDVDGALTYQWSITGDATIAGNSNSVTVTFGPAWNGGTLCVAAQTSCYTSPAKCLTISKSASAPNNLSGSFTACPNAIQSFSITPSSGAASYSWTLPPGASGASSTNSINVSFGPAYNSVGNICVAVTSICGVTSVPKCKTVAPGLPAVPAAVSGPLNGLCGQTVVYQCPTQSGTSFNWSAPAGATINSGQGTNAISVSYASLSTASLCVTATNSCGSSNARCVTAKGAPNSPASLSAIPGSWCANSAGIEFTADVSNITGSYTLNWLYPSAPTATYVLGGGNSNSLILDWGTGNGNVVVVASNACGSGSKTLNSVVSCRESFDANASSDFIVFPNPASDLVNVQFFSTKDANLHLQLSDLSGRILLDNLWNTHAGVNTHQMDLSQMAKGAYFIVIHDLKGTRQQKIVLQ